MSGAILAFNAGSSSVKFAVYGADALPSESATTCEGAVDGLGAAARVTIRDDRGRALLDVKERLPDQEAALGYALDWLNGQGGGGELVAIGHRIVHGGPDFHGPVRINNDVMAQLRALIPLAPLHQPHGLSAIEAVTKRHPDLPQVACFDTAFHQTQPRVASLFALPSELTAQGVRRYGFHGLSYEYIASVLPEILGDDLANGRVIVAHLGSGASLCALKGRRSIATTMGLTPLDGLVMATRCGSLDPGVVLYLMMEKGMTAEAITMLLSNESGLLGVSGISGDIRDLEKSPAPEAREAIDLFVYRIVREIGSLAAALGGLDALVFTGGIGEHAADIRAQICDGCSWLGIKVNTDAVEAGDSTQSKEHPRSFVIRTNENLIVARQTRAVVERQQKQKT